MLRPVQISNFTGILTNMVPVKLMTKNCTMKISWLERILNIKRDTQIDRTTVFRNYDGKCKEVPINTYEILVSLNTTVSTKSMYKVSFTPQIEIKSSSLFLVSDFIHARFKGLFDDSATLKIKVVGWNMFNPLKLVIYLLPLAIIVVFILILVCSLKFLFGTYTLRLSKEQTGQNAFTKILLTYAKKEKEALEIGNKNKVANKETELQTQTPSLEQKAAVGNPEGCEPRKSLFPTNFSLRGQQKKNEDRPGVSTDGHDEKRR